MKNINNVAKFFIVCGVIFAIGMVMTIGGAVAGGVKGMKKIAEESDWVNMGPGELTSEYMNIGDFDKVDVSGDVDVFLVTEKHFTDRDWAEDYEIDKALATIEGSPAPEAGHALVMRGDKVEPPEIKVDKGVLNIRAKGMSFNGVNLDFSDVSATPKVFVFCRDDALDEIKTSMLSGDLFCFGISYKKAAIKSESGDVFMKDVTGKDSTLSLTSGDADLSGKLTGTKIDCASGDVKMSGKLSGAYVDSKSGDVFMGGELTDETHIKVLSGDVDIDTELDEKKYTLDLKAASGDIEISEFGKGEEEFDDSPVTVQRGKGPNKITVDSKSGDINVSFQMPAEL